MFHYKRSSTPGLNDAVAIGELIMLLVIVPMGIGYIGASIFGFSVWSSLLLGLVSSLLIFLSLVALLGATIRFPDHLPGSESEAEV